MPEDVPLPTTEDMVPLPTTEDMEPLWRFYRFKDATKEQKYRQACEPGDLRVLRVCAAFHVFFHLLLPVFHVSFSHALPFGVCIAPIIQTLIGITILLLLLVPGLHKHSRLIFSIAMPCMAFACALGISWQTEMLLQHAKQSKLVLVYEVIGVHREVLDEYLQMLTFSIGVMLYYVACGPMFLFWVYIGMGAHAIAGAAAYALVIWPLVAVWCGFAAVGHGLLFMSHLLMVMFMSSPLSARARRMSFSLRQSFEDMYEKQAAAAAAQAARKADSILNHTLKNTMADAAGQITLFLEDMKAQGQDPNPDLQWAIDSLQRGMRSCQQRQALIQLVSSTYSVALRPVRAVEFVQALTAGRKVTVQVPDTTVFIDPLLCGIVLDNALSNALKHGHPQSPDIRLEVTISPFGAAEDGTKMLEIMVTNAVHPGRPAITEEYIKKVLAGEVQRGPSTSALSNYIGLQHSYMAAEAGGMKVSLTQEGDRVMFRLRSTAQEEANQPEKEDPFAKLLTEFPANLNVYFIDDSQTARRLVPHHLATLAQTKNVFTFGKTRSEVDTFVRRTLADGDIAILDQHLEFGADANVLGTDVIEQQLLPDFKGLICIRSGNTAPEDVCEYREAGAHCVFGKDMLGSAMVRELKAAYVLNILHNTPLQAESLAAPVRPSSMMSLPDSPSESRPCNPERAWYEV